MKKYIFGVLLALTLVVAPSVSSAATIADLQAQIAALMAQLAALTSTTPVQVCTVPTITKNLTVGSKGEEVSALQQYLIDEGLLASDGPTGYFGQQTKKAVMEWQKAHNVIPPNGYFGPIARAVLASLCSSDNGKVVISNVAGPDSLSVGQPGNWTFSLKAPNNAHIVYNIAWGDETAEAGDRNYTQNISFSHSYAKAGTYPVSFRVHDQNVCDPTPEMNSYNSCVSQYATKVVVGDSSGQGTPSVVKNSGRVSLVSEGGVAKLKSIFDVTVTAQGGDLYLPQSWPTLSSGFVRSKENMPAYANGCVSNNALMSGLKVLFGNDKYGYALLPAGQTAKYTVSLTCPVEQLFADTYTSKIAQINYRISLNDNDLKSSELNIRSDNSQYIVGEQGPWISNVTWLKGNQYVVYGERLSNSNLYFNGQLVSASNRGIALDGKSITFSINETGNLSPGVYLAYVVSVGSGMKSNTASVTVGTGTSNNPHITGAFYSANNRKVTVSGERLDRTTAIYIDNAQISVGYSMANGNMEFLLPTNIAEISGNHSLVLMSGNLGSNMVSLSVSNPVASRQCTDAMATGCFNPAIDQSTAPRISAIDGGLYPGGWVKLNGSRLTTDVRITKNGSSGLVVIPLSIKDTYGNGTRIDFQLPMETATGSYYINVYSASGLKSPSMPLSVTVKTGSAQSKASQMASVLSSLQSILDQLKAQ